MKYVLICAFCLSLTCGIGQVYVQLEKSGTLRTVRYAAGDVLTFQLKHDDAGWYDRTIYDLDIEHQKIIFPDVVVSIDSIEAIRLNKKATAAQIIGTAMQAGGINLILFTGYYAIFEDRNVDWKAMTSAVLDIAAGTAIKRIFRHKVFRPGPRKHIRLLDLRFQVDQ